MEWCQREQYITYFSLWHREILHFGLSKKSSTITWTQSKKTFGLNYCIGRCKLSESIVMQIAHFFFADSTRQCTNQTFARIVCANYGVPGSYGMEIKWYTFGNMFKIVDA